MADVSFNISYKELNIAQIAQANFSTLEFRSYIGHGFYELMHS